MPEDEKPLDSEDINYTTNTTSLNIDNTEIKSDTLLEKTPDEVKEEFVKPKKSILFKVLFGIIVLLIILLITGIILYFTGFFQKEEVKKVEQPITVETTTKTESAPENNYRFDIKDINSKKLNEQLANLTTKNTLENNKKEAEKKAIEEEKKKEEELFKKQEEELQKQKAQLEEKRLELEKEKNQLEAMKQEAKVLKEEIDVDINKDKVIDESKSLKETKKEDTASLPKSSTPSIKEKNIENTNKNESTNNQFLSFINVAKLKGVLYKKYLDRIVAINPNVKLCRDDKNRIEIYYGPFKSNEERNELLKKLIDNKFNEAYELEFTQEEYDKRCNY